MYMFWGHDVTGLGLGLGFNLDMWFLGTCSILLSHDKPIKHVSKDMIKE